MSGIAGKANWIAVDWGTTRLRVWALDQLDVVIAQKVSDAGMGQLERDGFEPALMKLIDPFLAPDSVTPVICCGMVGARQGWAEAPYAPVPCTPPKARDAMRVQARDPRLDVRILPGLSQTKPADVMRGKKPRSLAFWRRIPGSMALFAYPARIANGIT